MTDAFEEDSPEPEGFSFVKIVESPLSFEIHPPEEGNEAPPPQGRSSVLLEVSQQCSEDSGVLSETSLHLSETSEDGHLPAPTSSSTPPRHLPRLPRISPPWSPQRIKVPQATVTRKPPQYRHGSLGIQPVYGYHLTDPTFCVPTLHPFLSL